MFGSQILFERQPESMMTYANFDSLRPGFNMDLSSSLTTCGDLWVSTPFRGSFLFTLCERVVSQNASNPSDQIMKFDDFQRQTSYVSSFKSNLRSFMLVFLLLLCMVILSCWF